MWHPVGRHGLFAEIFLNPGLSNWILNCFKTLTYFEDGKYCGESFYEIDAEHRSAALYIKLFGFARGCGIATAGLSHAIKEAFLNGAEIVWVNPNPENMKAIALYERLGFQQKDFPEYLISEDEEKTSIDMELRKNWFHTQIPVCRGNTL